MGLGVCAVIGLALLAKMLWAEHRCSSPGVRDPQRVAGCTELIGIFPSRALPYVNRGLAHVRLGDAKAGVVDLDQAVLLRPDERSYRDRAFARASAGDHAAAIEDYGKVIGFIGPVDSRVTQVKLDPSETAADDHGEGSDLAAVRLSAAYYNRGVSFASLKDVASAIADYTEAIKLAPRYRAAFLARAGASLATRDYAQAILDANSVIRLDAKSAQAFRIRSAAFAARGEAERSAADAQRAAELGAGR